MAPSSFLQNLSDEEDRISTLPDHILLDILERLNDLRAVIKAGTLARRWVHLPRSASRLLLDVADFVPRDSDGRERRAVPRNSMDQVMTAYTTTLMRLVSSSGVQTIKNMQLSFFLRDPYMHSIGHAVGDVVERGKTDHLKLIIWPDTRNPTYEQSVLFGERFMVFFRSCPTTFRWLTSLDLKDITFGGSDVSTLLNTCSKLEFLSLTYCDSAFDLVTGEDTVLTINAPHSALLSLEMTSCEFKRIDLIHAPKLCRLVCSNWIGANPPVSFGDVPCLHHVALCCAASHQQRPFMLSHCLFNTSTLSVVYLNFQQQLIWVEPEGPKHLSLIFSNLRDVYLYNIFYKCDLNWTIFILEAAPSLNNFYLKLSRHQCESFRCDEDSANKVNMTWDQTSPHLKHKQIEEDSLARSTALC
ncbi:hypothetical protein QOZ80_5BG0456900 [Eleusine coracana subsp. coracana]|nr:hypothetical protein QOZ80_5BG0456900 [Eleusine coracana subsp. coracana]